jgi:CRP-like cAMP-binding protein
LSEAMQNPNDLLRALIHHGLQTRKLEFESGSVLYEYGASPKGLFFITSGTVRTFLPLRDRTIEIEKIGPGQFLGLPAIISDHASEATAVTEDAVKLVFISKDDVLDALRRDPRLLLSINSFLSDALSSAYKHIRNMRSSAHRLPA